MADGTEDPGQDVQVATCGCAAEIHRVCDLCVPAGGMFVACSLICLDRHLADKHGSAAGARAGTEARAHQYLGAVNRQLAGSWQRYQEHRGQVMALVLAGQ
jgi:hypothetical protein